MESPMKQAIFLSASVPDRELDKYEPRPLEIRECVLALVAIALQDRQLVFGGHPAISPLVLHAARSLNAVKNVVIFQSRWYEDMLPPEAKEFENPRWTERRGNREDSLALMREEMLTSEDFSYLAGVFIGGMDGVEAEYQMFTKKCRGTPAWPIASTAGMAGLLWKDWEPKGRWGSESIKRRLQTDKCYRALFRDLLQRDSELSSTARAR
jgi:hypothetical protein